MVAQLITFGTSHSSRWLMESLKDSTVYVVGNYGSPTPPARELYRYTFIFEVTLMVSGMAHNHVIGVRFSSLEHDHSAVV